MGSEKKYIPEIAEHYGRLKNYVDGDFVEAETGEVLDVMDPAKDRAIAQVPLSSKADVDAAVEAAQNAFLEWRATPPLSRARYMYRVKDLLEKNYDDLARVLTQEHGKVIDEARASVRRAIDNVEVAAGITSLQMGYNLEDGAAEGIDEEVLRQPLGVFACIAPYNFPALVPFWFWPYAVACGNTYIVKPSEQVPVTQTRIFELLEDAGFPPGVLNMVHGGRDTVKTILEHPDIKGVSFVGSTPVARIIYETAAKNGKRAQCQGGAKNCLVVMPDANMKLTLPNILGSVFGCTGQRCLAGSIIVAVGDIYETLRDQLVSIAGKIKVGYGLDETAQMGPLGSKAMAAKVVGYIDKGVAEGGKLLLDGRGVKVEGFPRGAFVGPTIFDDVTPEMTIMREEIFGPVCCIYRVGSIEEAIAYANTSPYGNASSLFTNSGPAARKFRYEVQAGNIGVNVGIAAAMAYFPFGGYKASFFGDLHGQGLDAINFFTERKVVITRWY
jgi:malonate-semialdehyde dehydrogenase (acetylating)/methylmalonate-semialdehyde dehydrogenase